MTVKKKTEKAIYFEEKDFNKPKMSEIIQASW
jgi:hypothetical protein